MPRRVLGPRDAVWGLQLCDDRGDKRDPAPSRPSTPHLSPYLPPHPFGTWEATGLARPLLLTTVRRDGTHGHLMAVPRLLALTLLDKA